jgi:glutathione S-transferase
MIDFYELAGADPEHRFSPYCWRIRMALAHKGLDARTIPWRFTEKNALPGSPASKRVPVLVDRGKVVSESTDIAYHLENAYPNSPSLFGGPGGEAHARFVIAWSDLVLVPGIFPLIAADIIVHLGAKDRAYFRETREKRLGCSLEEARGQRETLLPALHVSLRPLEATLKQQPFLGGDEPTYADYAVFGVFQWARCVSSLALLPPGAAIGTWMETMLDLFDGQGRAAVVKHAR